MAKNAATRRAKTKPPRRSASLNHYPPFAAVVLAAGEGTRMRSALPKPLHPLAGRPMIAWLMETLAGLQPVRTVVVVGPGMETVAAAVAPHPVAVQRERQGTGHAVMQARNALTGFDGTVLVLYADTPLIGPATLEMMLAARHGPKPPGIVVLGFRPDDPTGYGRLVIKGRDLQAIVEERDASPAQRRIGLVNAGAMAVDAKLLWPMLAKLEPNNAQAQYYFTDIVALAREAKLPAVVVEAEGDEVLGINSRPELAQAESVVQKRLRANAMLGGATFADPNSVFLAWDTKLGRDVTVEPNVVFGPGVTVEDGARILAFSHLEGAHVGSGARVGPFARLRPGARIGAGAHIGNYVEVKQAVIEDGAKANHLAYIGDARVGAGANIGAGTITCNYDGFAKSFTDIGAGAFIGSNTALVAPVTVGDGAVIGAGSVIVNDVAPGALSVARGEQIDRPGGADRLRDKKRATPHPDSLPQAGEGGTRAKAREGEG